jgi:serine/threonine protein kinase
LPEHFSPELKSLVARMLAVDPQQRLTLSEALKEDVARWDFGSDFWVKMG